MSAFEHGEAPKTQHAGECILVGDPEGLHFAQHLLLLAQWWQEAALAFFPFFFLQQSVKLFVGDIRRRVEPNHGTFVQAAGLCHHSRLIPSV